MARRMAAVCVFGLLACASVASAQVQEAWVSRFGGPGNSGDVSGSIAVDAAGNVYVTGSVGQSNGPWDYATAKYDAEGRELWVARYSGSGGAFDAARKVVVDQHGNVYVTGESAGAGTGFDYATVKYDSNGNELWVARYNGTASGADFARDLAVDSAGNVYVTGSSTPGPDIGTADYVTIKYDPQGNELWVARYNGPGNADDGARAIAVDHTGQVYVTGNSAGINPEDFDYATVKYHASGTQLWVARHAGPLGSFDFAVDVAVDAALNVYVTGIEDGDYGTVKYDADGNPLWVARYNGPAHSTDQPRALDVDDAGNVVVTGISFDEVTDFDYATVKYDANGTERWVARYNGPADGGDSAFALAVDGSGSVYVTGNSMGSGTGLDYATIKYDVSGNEVWVARHDGPASSGDSAVAIAVDSAGDVYVTGSSFTPETNNDFATVKYSQPPAPPPAFTLTVRKTGSGGVGITSNPSGIRCGRDCSQAYVSGTSVTLTASAAFGTTFVGWRGCDTVAGMTCTVTMHAHRSVTVRVVGGPRPFPRFIR